MKKLLLILVGFALAVGVLGVAGYAYAQTQPPSDPWSPDSSGMGGRGGREAGQRNPGMSAGGDMGLLEDYMHPAIAETFGLTVEALETMHAEGVTLWQYAEEQDLTSEEFNALMQTTSATAINNAVADGAITQEQADFMLERMQNVGKGGFPGAAQRSPGMSGGRGGFAGAGQRGSGMSAGGDMGLLEDYMHPAIADAFGLSVDTLDAMHDESVTLWQYAEEQGLISEEFNALMQTTSAIAINNAVADGAITQEQADFMLERMQNVGKGGFPGAEQHSPGMSGGRGDFTGTCWSDDQ